MDGVGRHDVMPVIDDYTCCCRPACLHSCLQVFAHICVRHQSPSLLAPLCTAQLHLQFNPLLHAVFGYHPLHAPPERRSAQEKRALRGGASKIRGAARRGARAAKDGAMRAYDGGEDAC